MDLADGGLFNNNPAPAAINEAMLIFPDADIDLVLSLGTGISEQEVEAAKRAPDSSSLLSDVKMVANAATNSQVSRIPRGRRLARRSSHLTSTTTPSQGRRPCRAIDAAVPSAPEEDDLRPH